MTQRQPHSHWKSVLTGITRSVHDLLSERVIISCARALALVSMCALVFSITALHAAPKAFAAQAKPPTDWSFYMTSASTSTAYNLGCNQGHFDAGYNPVVSSEVVLDFGGQLGDGSGSLMINGMQISNAQIQAVAEAFSRGYWICTGNDSTSTLYLGIGTNNSYYDVSYAGGQTWANNVAGVQAYNKSMGYTAQVAMFGANDIETWCDKYGNNCVSPTPVKDWVSGFSSVPGGYKYFDYGSADGCPTNSSNNGWCNPGWSQYDFWYLSWGAPAALAVPEIYYSGNAQQWAMISLYGWQYQRSLIYFPGPMDEYDLNNTTLTSSQAWNDLWTDLNNNSGTAEDM